MNSTNLFDTTLLGMTDVADVFAFSNIPTMTGQPQAGNLLDESDRRTHASSMWTAAAPSSAR